MTPGELRKFIDSETLNWLGVIAKAGIKPQ
jgi:hypothetical protein